MAETDGSSPLSPDPTVEELFAEALASVERHARRAPSEQGEGDGAGQSPSSQDETLVVDFEMGDLDGLSSSLADDDPVEPAPEGLGRLRAEHQEEIQHLERELEAVQTHLRRRELDITNMLKRFEEAQRRYKAKVREAEVNAQRAQELKDQLDQRGLELKRMVDRAKQASEQIEAVRRRAAREKAEMQRYGNDKAFRAMLPVVDNFERALLHATASPDALKEGVEMILAQLLGTMAQFGVQRVSASPGDVFDPSLHEAMVRITTDQYPPGTVFEVLQKGYIYQDRLLRAALVSVAQPDPNAWARPGEDPASTPSMSPDEIPIQVSDARPPASDARGADASGDEDVEDDQAAIPRRNGEAKEAQDPDWDRGDGEDDPARQA